MSYFLQNSEKPKTKSQSYCAESARQRICFVETEQWRHPMDPHVYYSWLFLRLTIAYANSTSNITAPPAHNHVLCSSATMHPTWATLLKRKHWSSWHAAVTFSLSALWSCHNSLNTVRSIHIRKKKLKSLFPIYNLVFLWTLFNIRIWLHVGLLIAFLL